MKKYDVVIAGSGIAGISAAIYLRRNGKSVLIVESSVPGGQLNRSNTIENYPGYISVDGPTLAMNLYNQALELQTEYLYEEIVKVDLGKKELETSSNIVSYSDLIIATGRSPKKLSVLNEYIGKGVSYCALCDGALYKNKDVIVVGGGSSAFEEAYYLSKICNSVTILNRTTNLKAEKKEIEEVQSRSNIKVILEEEITDVSYNKKEELFDINDKYKVSAIFVAIGYEPNSNLFEVEKNNGYIIVDNHFRTNINNVYAVGDVVEKEIYQLITAANDGVTAAIDIIRNQK